MVQEKSEHFQGSGA